jgi:hypothetical protein
MGLSNAAFTGPSARLGVACLLPSRGPDGGYFVPAFLSA